MAEQGATDLAAAFSGRGVLGFIGSTLARRLVEPGARVTLVDSLIPEFGGNLFNVDGIADRVRVNISDVRDPFSMATLVAGHNFLFNLAGQTSHLDSMRDPHTDLEINCRAQLTILAVCPAHCPGGNIVFASTRQIYGTPQYLPVDEEHRLHPVDVNGINKLAAGVGGLRSDSVALCHQVTPLDRGKLREPIGRLLPLEMARVEVGLKAALDLS